jgi:para-nitrobenzyl esterase
MVCDADAAARFADQFAGLLGARRGEAAATVKRAEPWRMIKALDRLLEDSVSALAGSFPIGPTVDGDYLPHEPVEAIALGEAHRVPVIVVNIADEGRLFTRWLKMMPMTERVIERMLADLDPQARARILAAYPDYQDPDACVRLGADMCFGTAAWQIADAHCRHAQTWLYRYDYAPRTLNWAGLGATHAMELLAVFDAYRTWLGSLLTLAADRPSALRVSRAIQSRWRAFGRTGVPGKGWPPYTDTDRPVMVFDSHSRVEFDPTAARRQAWEGFKLGETRSA